MGCINQETDGCSAPQKKEQRPLTIREELDRKIKAARKHVEELCITKAKLEALNVLDHPVELYYRAVF